MYSQIEVFPQRMHAYSIFFFSIKWTRFNPTPSQGGSKMTLNLLNTKVELFLTPMYFYINVYKNRLCMHLSHLARSETIRDRAGPRPTLNFRRSRVKMQRIIFDLRWKNRSNKILGKKWYFEKVKSGVGVYSSGAIWIRDVWDMGEKITQSLYPKFRFSPISN